MTKELHRYVVHYINKNENIFDNVSTLCLGNKWNGTVRDTGPSLVTAECRPLPPADLQAYTTDGKATHKVSNGLLPY